MRRKEKKREEKRRKENKRKKEEKKRKEYGRTFELSPVRNCWFAKTSF